MYRLILLMLALLAAQPVGSRPAHDFHASVTQMTYNVKERSFELSIRAFTDDLEKALSATTGTKVHLTTGTKFDPIIEKYVRAHVAYMTPQKQPRPLTYVGHEVEADAHWIYLEMPYTEPFRGGVMKQDLLMDLFDDQVNMVNLQYQGQKKTFVFRKNQAVQEVSF
ncbi:DUF6702 family protein [Spirosoma luteolum]